MPVNTRIKELRQALKLSQANFSKGISISNGYIAGIELNKRKVNDRIIKLICFTYNVSEIWLRTGEGEMFANVPDVRLTHILTTFKTLRPEFQEYVLRQISHLIELQQKVTEENPDNRS
ncbi:MAG: helix-turn-helix transcriptional regulator [Firmicutes bacterium]|nr:helix-turn-helix transcriptional regulator [Bacillota bacterium]